MSEWRNKDGKTVRRNAVAAYFASRPVQLTASLAMRALTRSAHSALLRIEIELRQHAGRCNGKLIVTKQQFVEFGLHPRMITPALRELEALGIIRIEHGRGGNAQHYQPNRFRLNFMCGAVDDTEPFTDPWKRFKTIEEAKKVASAARKAKDPNKVAYGRRTAQKRNISRAHKVTLVPGAQSDPEAWKFPGAQSVPTGPGAQSVPTVDISGGGGDVVGSIRKRPKTKPAWAPPALTEVFGAERDELLKILAIAELVRAPTPDADDWRRNAKTVAERLDDDLFIPKFLLRTAN